VAGGAIEIEFLDGSRGAVFGDEGGKPNLTKPRAKSQKHLIKKAAVKKPGPPDDSQGSLL
jgi:hypothetical protein